MTTKVTNAQLQEQLSSFSTQFQSAINALTETTKAAKDELGQKIDGINTRLDTYGVRLEKLERDSQHNENRIGELTAQVQSGDLIVSEQFRKLTARVKDLEGQLENLTQIPEKIEKVEEKMENMEELQNKVSQLTEQLEDRTNRQLRETLVFRNIPEGNDEHSYNDTRGSCHSN